MNLIYAAVKDSTNSWRSAASINTLLSPEVLIQTFCSAEIQEVDEPKSPAGLKMKSKEHDNSDTERAARAQDDR